MVTPSWQAVAEQIVLDNTSRTALLHQAILAAQDESATVVIVTGQKPL